MGRKEGQGVYQSIEHRYTAEKSDFSVMITGLKARGQHALEACQQLEQRLVEMGFDAARHLRDIARGRIDLWWAIGLTIVNCGLALLALSLGGGPLWMTALLALVVLATALPVEEFFSAYDEKATLREGVFLVLSLIGLAATFHLGTLRGIFLVGQHSDQAGPISDMLRASGVVLRYALGVLALVTETLAGFKWFRVRQQLFSSVARTVRKRDRLKQEMVGLVTSVKAAEVEAEIRREYRTVGARQHLAQRDRAQAEAQRLHLRRAVIGAIIALVVLIGVFFIVSRASAEMVPAKVRIVVLDETRSTKAEAFTANVQAVDEMIRTIPNGTRLLVLGVADNFGSTPVLFDQTLRSNTSAFSDFWLQADREHMAAEWQKAMRGVRPTFNHTNLIGSLSMLPYIVGKIDGSMTLWLLSDGREDVRVDIEHVPEINVARTMAELRRTRSIPALSGLNVYMSAVDPSGKSAGYFASLRALWYVFFEEAGAHVRAFRVDRANPFLERSSTWPDRP